MNTVILVNGVIRADAFSDPVDALAIRDGRVLAAGTVADIQSIAGGAALTHNLDGATVIPGLVESHVHPMFFGLTQGWVDCRSPKNRSIADIQQTLRERARVEPSAEWVRGWGYDDTLLVDGRHPTRDDLDTVSTSVPVVISHISGHFLVANTVALDIAGINESSLDPAEGKFVRDADGRLTGLMWEIGAVNRVLAALPKPDAEQLEKAALYALTTAAARGMTSIHDLGIGLMAGELELETWERLADAGRLPVRVTGYLRGDLATTVLGNRPDLFRAEPQGNFRLAGAKYWADGSIQGLSAALGQPYSCAEDSCGELLLSESELTGIVQQIDSAGGQCAIHANGDRAVRAVVDALAKVRAEGGRSDARHRIEHLQMAAPDDIDDLISAGGVASIFANHIYYWGDRHREIFIGDERASRLNPLAEATAKGLHFGLHSDCPITPMDSLRTLWTAVVRQTSSGQTLGADQRISAAQALHALTADSAWLTGDEEMSGTLRPGMNADLAVLDKDVLAIKPEEIENVAVLGTMVGGKWVYKA